MAATAAAKKLAKPQRDLRKAPRRLIKGSCCQANSPAADRKINHGVASPKRFSIEAGGVRRFTSHWHLMKNKSMRMVRAAF